MVSSREWKVATAPGGYIDRAIAFDYPAPDAEFLRPEFASLTRFVNYCLARFAPRAAGTPAWRAAQLVDLTTRRFRERGLR